MKNDSLERAIRIWENREPEDDRPKKRPNDEWEEDWYDYKREE